MDDTPKAGIGGTKARSSEPPTVYVVKDDAPARESFGALLTSAGFDARLYATGESFLQHFDARSRSCLLLDSELEGASGLEILEALAACNASLPTILLVAGFDRRTKDEAKKFPEVEAVLDMPVNPRVLLENVDRAMRRRH